MSEVHKYVYHFSKLEVEGSQEMKHLLGGKGANLAEMMQLGLPVPPGFTITTEVCHHYETHQRTLPEGLGDQVMASLRRLEEELGASFGSGPRPLLVSVRSGAMVSMPGMMDTILNLGLNDETVESLAEATSNRRFALDAYRRFIQMYGEVVMGVDSYHFERKLMDLKSTESVKIDSQLSAQALSSLILEFKQLIVSETGLQFPQQPMDQLWGAVGAVLSSWQSDRAISYRRIAQISDKLLGTAVNVQAMVFGNMGEDSATGVAFTRDPGSGEKIFFGEYLINAQGEDVVAGIRTPEPLSECQVSEPETQVSLEKKMPEVYSQLVEVYQKLEKHYRDMQDIEFTVEQGNLFLLQTRTGKRSASAAVRIAVEMVKEGLISEKEALLRVTPKQIENLLHPRLDPRAEKKVLGRGLPASPGAASGEVVFSSEEAVRLKEEGKKVLLVRHDTSPEDIAGMDASEGILTALGGMTSHAAVVARGMGKPCVAGCSALSISYAEQTLTIGEVKVSRGELITIDGSSGQVFLGLVPTINSQVDAYYSEFMSWVDATRTLEVRANAETIQDVKVALHMGAQGVGLSRTEHMFFEPDRLSSMREMILAVSEVHRKEALDKLFPVQKEDFLGFFRAMQGKPVTIRLLDPPLHEFLPKSPRELKDSAGDMNMSLDQLTARVQALKEMNPMLGHRGCRLGISFPEIYEMQVRAILEAATQYVRETSQPIVPEIMVPFVTSVEEFVLLKQMVHRVRDEVNLAEKMEVQPLVGTMIEIPRAAIVAGDIARHADFFSFGTNDLTQMTLGLSRDDSGSFLPAYVDKGLFAKDPFVSIDEKGVGYLIRHASVEGVKANASIKLGICGEHGGDPDSIGFCHKLKFSYVSCSPFRIPIARLSAAQAVVRES